MINIIEEIQFEAWPALHTLVYDGWILRTSEGVTRRSNSISPILHSTIKLNEKLSFCEDHYARRSLPVIFKLTRNVYPGDLDSFLAERGYVLDAETWVQVLDIKDSTAKIDENICISDSLNENWMNAFIDYNGYDPDKTDAYRHILNAIKADKAFILLKKDDKTLGCGLGVIVKGYLGIFDIVVLTDQRNRGFGRKIVESLIAWGRASAAHTAYLQVMMDNPAGLNLYEKLGFKKLYKYWYRVRK